MKIFIILIIYHLFLAAISANIYCSSFCAASLNACTSPWITECTTCQSSVFTVTPATTGCATLTQKTVFASQLLMYKNFTASGYLSNSGYSVQKCTGSFDYYILGGLGSNSYIMKTFTGLGINHYSVNIFYGYAIMGSPWSQTFLLQMIDPTGTVVTHPTTPGASCTYDTLTGCTYTSGCYINYAPASLSFKSDSLTLKFSLAATLATGQSWGIRDIIIVLSTCDPSCATCSGSAASNCLTCAAGLYFSGTQCVAACPFYTMPDAKTCVVSCPTYYFLNTANNYCEACPSGCLTCTATDQCITWEGDSNNPDLFKQYIGVWIVLIILCLLIIAILIWKFCLTKKTFYNSMEEEVIDHRVNAKQQLKEKPMNHSHETMEAHWVQDIDDLHMNKAVKTRMVKDRISGIGVTQDPK